LVEGTVRTKSVCRGRYSSVPVPRRARWLNRIFAIICAGCVACLTVCGLLQPRPADASASTRGDKAAGAILFHERGCEHCHGADGNGGGLGPNLSNIGMRRTKSEIERQIRNGGGGMPAFQEVLLPDEIEDLVAFLHEKKRNSPATVSLSDQAPRSH
jgi:mono/diheme cytochrome c family protein